MSSKIQTTAQQQIPEMSVVQCGICLGIIGGVGIIGKTLYDIQLKAYRTYKNNPENFMKYFLEKAWNISVFVSLFQIVGQVLLPQQKNSSKLIAGTVGLAAVYVREKQQTNKELTHNINAIFKTIV